MARSIKVLETANNRRPARQRAVGRTTRSQLTFPNEAFASEAAYNQSVESVMALIKSGEVQPRVPDEE